MNRSDADRLNAHLAAIDAATKRARELAEQSAFTMLGDAMRSARVMMFPAVPRPASTPTLPTIARIAR